MINGMRNETSARSGEIVWIMWWSWENGSSSASLADTWITTTAREVIYRWRKMLRLGEQSTRESRGQSPSPSALVASITNMFGWLPRRNFWMII